MRILMQALSIILLLNPMVLIGQARLEENYKELKSCALRFGALRDGYIWVSTGEDIQKILGSASSHASGVAAIQSSFERVFLDRKGQIDQFEKEISTIKTRLEEVHDYEITGQRYKGINTIVINHVGEQFAVSKKIPLSKTKIYRLEYNGNSLSVPSSSSSGNVYLQVYDMYDGRYEKQIAELTKKKEKLSEALGKDIKKFIFETYPKIINIKSAVLDSLISINTTKFEQNLKNKDFLNAISSIDDLQYYIYERDENLKNFDVFAARLLDEQYFYIQSLLDKDEIKDAEMQTTIFKELNWNRPGMKKLADELNSILGKKKEKK